MGKVKEVEFKWKDVAPDAIPVMDNEGTVGLLTEEEWYRAIARAQETIMKIYAEKILKGGKKE